MRKKMYKIEGHSERADVRQGHGLYRNVMNVTSFEEFINPRLL